MSLHGLTKSILDKKAQTAIVIATAQSANVSEQYVSFIKQTLKNAYSHKKSIQSYTYDIDTTTQLIIPGSLYVITTINIINSVGNGDFNTFLGYQTGYNNNNGIYIYFIITVGSTSYR